MTTTSIMLRRVLPLLLLLLLMLAGLATAHGPALSPAALQKREEAHLLARRAFSSCQAALQKRTAHDRRREAFLDRYLRKRQNATPTTTISQPDIATGTNTVSPFQGIPTCVLAPESVQGPYYLPSELIRDDMRESQRGVPLLLDLQVFDANSCQVLPDVMIDFWHANATGSYGGYASEGTLGETWLRGLAQTDAEGVAQMVTIFPGHYDGRAIHIHIMAHLNGRVANNRYTGGTNPFVGQLFFNMSLISEVEAIAPYNTNTNPFTSNSQDSIFRRASTSVPGWDGLMDVRKLGSNVEDGIIAWISVGIDRSSNHDTGFSNDAAGSGGGGGSSTGMATGVGSAVFAAKLVAAGMGAVVAAVAFFG